MNPVEHTLNAELNDLLERLAETVPEGCLAAVNSRPTLRLRLEEAETQLAAARAGLVEGYGRWCRALEDLENIWALAAWRSVAEDPAQQPPALAA